MPASISSTAVETRPQQPSPFRLFQAINAFHLTEAIRSAIELDIFTAIGAGHRTQPGIARQCSVAERGARILCDFLVVNGFLTKSGQEYALTDDSAMFLAYLTIIPAMAIFIFSIETNFFLRYQRFYYDILEHKPLATLRENYRNNRMCSFRMQRSITTARPAARAF